MLEDNVDAAAGGQALHFPSESGGGMQDHLVGALRFRFFDLSFRTYGGNHAGTDHLSNLNRGAAYAAAAGEHQDRFAGRESCPCEQHVPRRKENQRHRRSFREGNIFGLGDHVRFRYGDQFRAPSVPAIAKHGVGRAQVIAAGQALDAMAAGNSGRQDNGIADADARNVRADGGNFAGNIRPGDMRKRKGDARDTAANPNVEMIQGTGSDPHQHVAWTDHWIGDFTIFEDFGPSVTIEGNGLHEHSLCTNARRLAPLRTGKDYVWRRAQSILYRDTWRTHPRLQ